MQLLQSGVIAALAAIGLTSLVWLTVSVVCSPRLPECAAAAAVVPASGSAERLEQTVRHLQRVRYEERAFSRIVILDCGMDAEARRLAELLCRENYGIEICDREALFASVTE